MMISPEFLLFFFSSCFAFYYVLFYGWLFYFHFLPIVFMSNTYFLLCHFLPRSDLLPSSFSMDVDGLGVLLFSFPFVFFL